MPIAHLVITPHQRMKSPTESVDVGLALAIVHQRQWWSLAVVPRTSMAESSAIVFPSALPTLRPSSVSSLLRVR